MENLRSTSIRSTDTAEPFFADKKIKINVCEEVSKRLKELDVDESCSADFHQELWSHFNRLPARYAMDVKFDRIKDILMHKKLLDLAKSHANRPAVHVRAVKVHPCDEETNKPIQIMHEITCASDNKPRLLSEFTYVLALMNLRIKEASALSTKDGYSLLVFVVVGCKLKKPEQLREAFRKEFLKTDQVAGLRKIDPLQDRRLNDDIERQLVDRLQWLWWHVPEVIIFLFSASVAVYFAVIGLALMYEKSSEDKVLKFVVSVGKGLVGQESSNMSGKDIGVAIVFVAVPLLGIVSVLLLLVEAICTSMITKAKVLIVPWLLAGSS